VRRFLILFTGGDARRFWILFAVPIVIVVMAGFTHKQVGGADWPYYVVGIALGLAVVFYVQRSR
jgi:Na+/melibiose symporter-like transporter